MFHSIIAPMLIGFALFMFGMKAMELALHRSVGKHLHHVLQKTTQTPLHGLAVGTAATAVLQSSTAVTVMSIGLVNAGLLTFPRTLGIILGTNIGTCLTTELIGLNINHLAWPLLVVALGLWVFTALFGEMKLYPQARGGYAFAAGGLTEHRWFQPLRSAAVIIGGFALLLIGISIMQSIAPAVQSSGLFGAFLERAEHSVVWGLAAGIVLSAAVHSSAAVIGIIMGLASVGAMPVEIGIAVVLGANIGTCITAFLASLGGTKSGRFVAWSHIALNVGGAALFAPFVTELQTVSAWLSATPSGQIAHAQTVFNILSSLIALPVCYHPALKRMSV
ncbi:Na/Pi cotransporter family protein [Paenibacillus nasutitermitis]|uniref:Na/Pi-cotransporter n=1 Tax=Paenibacillus nasutitermitis TaxID=1652958 RepID=A0A916Z178_9BACL|nr:Na/Pi symporter [Paenibacillus nasutitermitis]GGD71581.1 Na/Pi-cotransporter [Paenibacillus nasutitermitis]